MRSLKYIKSGLLPISISVSPVHSLDDGTCHKHNLVGAGETIRWCIAWPSGSLLVGSGAACLPQGFPSDHQFLGQMKWNRYPNVEVF